MGCGVWGVAAKCTVVGARVVVFVCVYVCVYVLYVWVEWSGVEWNGVEWNGMEWLPVYSTLHTP